MVTVAGGNPRSPALGDSPNFHSTNNILTVDYNNQFKYN